MRKDPSQHYVHIDGIAVSEPIGLKIPLQDGSIISLWGQTGFAYLVKILCDNQDDQEAKPNNHNVNVKCQHDKVSNQSTCQKRRADSPPSPPNSPKKPTPHQDIRRRGHQLMVGEQTCSLCMDILIRSTFAYPCGHAFCAECTGKCCNVCPTCRGHVQGWMPARSFDTIIWATALQGCLDPEDAKSYLQRRKESGEEEPTIHEKECILGKAAQKENGGENGYYLPSPSPCYPTPLNSTTLLPPLFSGAVNPAFHSCPTSWTVNSGSYLPNSRSGTSAEDAICLDSP
ncbi:hypothetical protein HJC23_008237 [Cyclotella cryptica]|uniref:RING-type domain-containing protein n=1 Tax=Cyclotella cryptica TaxID=29204 RepID=A0ABD3QC82_9STRA|eukprot:CCRYP_008372-RA/>CCRYP_008372-RA protein AED:0.40 eAED:0.40 QI:0/0/0/1/1/1/3/0/285